jgi:hypothetical protein
MIGGDHEGQDMAAAKIYLLMALISTIVVAAGLVRWPRRTERAS